MSGSAGARPPEGRAGETVVVPRAEHFAGASACGNSRLDVAAGPVRLDLRNLDARLAGAVRGWAGPEAPPGTARSGDVLEVDARQLDREVAFADLAFPGERLKLTVDRDRGALRAVTREAALLASDDAAAALLLIAGGFESERLGRAVQNVLRALVAWRMALTRRGLLLHAAAVTDAGRGVLFVGPSGAGKSTAARLSSPRAVLADDAALVELAPPGARLHPSPFFAEPSWPSRPGGETSTPLALACLLRKAESHALTPVTASRAAAALAAHAPFLDDPVLCAAGTDLAAQLARSVPVAELSFRADAGFWHPLALALPSGAGSPSWPPPHPEPRP